MPEPFFSENTRALGSQKERRRRKGEKGKIMCGKFEQKSRMKKVEGQKQKIERCRLFTALPFRLFSTFPFDTIFPPRMRKENGEEDRLEMEIRRFREILLDRDTPNNFSKVVEGQVGYECKGHGEQYQNDLVKRTD